MKDYEAQYYFVMSADEDRLPSLTPNKNTEDRRFRYERQPLSSPPLMFSNGAQDYQRKKNISPVDTPPDVLFSGSNLVVRSKIREKLLGYDVPNLYMHPTVYIHDDGKWHEDYWYMTFTDMLDCWDRNSSEYDPEPIELGGFKLFSVYSYGLDKTMLDSIPLEQRLLFKMGGTLDGFVVCHESISLLLGGGSTTGATLVSVADFE